jgi:hypothetical protein
MLIGAVFDERSECRLYTQQVMRSTLYINMVIFEVNYAHYIPTCL